MAVTVTAVAQPSGQNVRGSLSIWDIIATADADTTATITHGLGGGVAPQDVQLTNLLQAPAGVSAWAVTGFSATQITLTKGTGVGSGNAGAQLRAIVRLPHTMTA